MRRIIIDATKCDGCKNCTLACMQAHSEREGSIYDLDLTDISNESRNHIVQAFDGTYKPIFCRHCDQPECVMSCMSGALQKDKETGLVLYNEAKCGSCFMCVMNCPYGVLKADTKTRTKVIKCDFCIDAGGEPSCVKACPKQAIYVEEV
ncbi:4Fe-4S dicluster domain-containing protein [Lachnotalea glycerini]|jgi:carbon-monoxide dehydrogenase iron sulfur subunit|uniref:4Fe-4S dicluster domain-containing protein n=1 Tax=Lachnotalea glycerini TaxID=1763509 RepID=A0A371JI12_9FIRM|nr:4Fe-4S dicluster domain-containing protein [Lachnotalea glycerini]RDY32370.1 4Fe-4S dicluster domain-containing protein [Lachnotalea glycerini]